MITPKLVRIARLILTLVMIYFIYKEAGFFTSLFAFVIGVESELNSIILKRIGEAIKKINQSLNQ